MKTSLNALIPGLLLIGFSIIQAGTGSGEIKEHTEVIESGEHTYEIEVGGTVCPENLEITIENIGDMPVKNPRITVNGRYNWYTLEDMAAEITTGCVTEKEKAMAVFDFVEKQSYWWSYPKDRTSLNPVRHFNSYGYHICSQAACQFVGLCRAAGLEARVVEIWHHTVSEAKWDGVWHHMDPDIGVWYLKGDNSTVASMADLEEHPEWVARAYKPYRWYLTPGDNRKMIYKPDADPAGEDLATIYETKEDNYVETGYDEWLYQEQNMSLTLRPLEKLVRWWKPVLRKYYDQKISHEPPRYANGQLVFEPDFKRFTYEGMVEGKNVRFYAQDNKYPVVHVDKLQDRKYDQPSRLTIPMESPYVVVGGYIDSRYYKGGTSGLDEISLAADLDPAFHRSSSLWSYYSWAYGMGDCRAVLDEKMLRDGSLATYGFKAIYTISADKSHENQPAEFPLVYGGQSGLDQVKIVADLEVNPGSLPALSLGRNIVSYRDESPGGRKVKVTYKWREISDQHAPSAPQEAVRPKDGEKVSPGFPFFEWAPAADPDGDQIVCYRFQLSLSPDCKWPLCSTFDRDVRQGNRVFQTPKGWLNPKTTYYWRVRTEDGNGNWSPWSKVFSFTTR
ncbi:MAG TPA: transglutaminase domain-containing protein [archaeon]|nr:transglutaminase domain-containing protein [archaeon]